MKRAERGGARDAKHPAGVKRCFEMNMNDKTFIFSPDAPSGFFSGIFFPHHSAESKN